jgi:hypothetical protein
MEIGRRGESSSLFLFKIDFYFIFNFDLWAQTPLLRVSPSPLLGNVL